MLIVATSAEIELLKELRMREYLTTVRWLKENAAGHPVVFIECVTQAGSFIENDFPVHYAGCHDPTYRNKGASLGRSLRQFFSTCEVADSLVLQITGRYHFLDRSFVSAVENNPGYDFYGREIDEIYGAGLRERRKQYFTGAFAMRTELLRDWLNETDFQHLETHMINIERCLWQYVERQRLSAYHVDCVRMDCNVFGNGRPDQVVF